MNDNAFIDMIHNIDFLYGFIYECTDLINNLYDHNNYDHLVRKLCNKFILPIIDITKNEHIKEYNTYIEDTKDVKNICSYLSLCSEKCFELSQKNIVVVHVIAILKKVIENVCVLLIDIKNFVKKIILFKKNYKVIF